MRRDLLRGIAGTAILAAALALAGCVGIPTSGPVVQGPALANDSGIDLIFQPSEPVAGSTQDQILSGFIRAALNPQKDFEVAREYLSSGFSSKWDPDAGVTIDAGARQTTVPGEDALDLLVTPSATVDKDGEYSEETSTAPISLSFTFAKNPRGEWRITSAPNGVVMSSSEFNEVFKGYAIYFFDPTYRVLVPDLRWFPRVGATTGFRIVSALLGGPAPWLGNGAVRSAFPEGTSVTSVPIESGLARVVLNGPVLDQSSPTLQRMQTQLEASLSTITGVTDVQMVVDQNDVAVATAGPPQASIPPRVDARALVLRDGKFGFVAGDGVSPIDGISEEIEGLVAAGGVSSVTYSAADSLAAAATVAGITSVSPGTTPGLVDTRPGLIAPTIDTFGFIWTVPKDSPQAIQVAVAGRTPSAVATNWDGATNIASLAVSRDGTRLLAFLTSDGSPRLIVAAIIRDKDNVPVSLGAPLELAEGAGTAVGASWVDQLSVASVTALPDGHDAVMQQQVGGPSTSLANSAGIRSVVGSNDLASLRLFSSDGAIQQQRGSGWQTSTTGISLLATQE
jgi:hypothetical protein